MRRKLKVKSRDAKETESGLHFLNHLMFLAFYNSFFFKERTCVREELEIEREREREREYV